MSKPASGYGTQWSVGPAQFSFGGFRPDLLIEANALHARRDLNGAIAKYMQACLERPNRARAFHDLGIAFVEASLGLTAVPFLLRAHRLQPADRDYLNDIVYAFLRSGRFARAERLIEESASRSTRESGAVLLAALEKARAGQAVETWGLAHPVIRSSGTEAPDRPAPLATESASHANHRAFFSGLSSRFEAAFAAGDALEVKEITEALEPLLAEDPAWGEGLHMFGLGRMLLGHVADGERAMARAAEILPGRHDLWDHLAQACKQQEEFDRMRDAFEESLGLNPTRAESWNNAADACLELGRHIDAYQYALQAIRLAPAMVQAYFNLARATNDLGNVDQAVALHRKVLEMNPEFHRAWHELGSIHLTLGDHEQAVHCYEKVLEVSPGNAGALSGLLFSHNYMGSETAAELFARARRFGELLALPPQRDWKAVDRTPERPLRVGFVSGDFHGHPVGKFFCTVVESLSRVDGLELFAYPTSRSQDVWTERIRACFGHWQSLVGLHVEEAERIVLEDRIDILVDLSGHTAKHRLWLFARRPAPIQVSWLGYFATTGVKAMDYLLAGPWDVPPEEEACFTEQIWRLPHTRLCFSVPMADVQVAPLPMRATGQVTFGCFNNIRKINDQVIALWSRILSAVPGSMLYLKNRPLESEAVRNNLQERFARHGIAPDRLRMEPASDYASYLDSFAGVDISLDPFPYTGGTTTIESLWMGVPVLTLKGDRLLSRQGESMLRELALPEWVAESEEDYLARAVQFAADAAALAALRAALRPALQRSALMDAPRFAADLNAAFRGMWQRWLQSGA